MKLQHADGVVKIKVMKRWKILLSVKITEIILEVTRIGMKIETKMGSDKGGRQRLRQRTEEDAWANALALADQIGEESSPTDTSALQELDAMRR